MADKYDAGDRRRLKRILIELLDGFIAADTTCASYIYFEQAIETVIIAMTKASECLSLSVRASNGDMTDKQRDLLCKELYQITQDASAQSYTALGAFFYRYFEHSCKLLDCKTHFGTNYGFAHRIENLKKQWE